MPENINNVLVKETGKGKEAMILASQVVVDVHLEKDLSYLEWKPLIEKYIFHEWFYIKKTFV